MNDETQHHSVWSSKLPELQEDYLKLFEDLEGDTEGRIEAHTYLNQSTAFCHGDRIFMGYLPKLYDPPALRHFNDIVETTNQILTKVTDCFVADESYRRLFKFSHLLEQMILLPTQYDCTIPIARFDIFLNEETGEFTFCEFNTDGTSAMSEDYEVANALANTPLLRRFALQHQVEAQELHDTWVEAFMRIYEGSTHAFPVPVVAIVDYMGSAIAEEQMEFRKRFEEHGVVCLVADISNLEYRDGALYARDISKSHPAYTLPMRIDAVYRRAVTHELLEELERTSEEALAVIQRANLNKNMQSSSTQGKLDQSETSGIAPEAQSAPLKGALALLAAVAEQSVCMMGGFKTQVAHSKALYCMLHHPKTHTLLTPKEQQFVTAHVPYTTWLKPDSIDIDEVKRTKDRWIIKPVDGYMSRGVEAGKVLSEQAWNKLIDECVQENYIIQEYSPQFQTLNTLPIPLNEKGTPLFSNLIDAEECIERNAYNPQALQNFNILTGLYSYAGSLGGVYIRAGQDAVIVGYRGGITMCSLIIDRNTKTSTLSGGILRPRALMD